MKKTLTNSVRRVNVPLAPLEIYAKVREQSTKSFLLESVEGTEKTARYSFIGFEPIFEFKSKGCRVEVDGEKYKVEDPYEELRKIFSNFVCGRVGTIPFSGGLVGYFSYDMVRFFEKLPSLVKDCEGFPDAHFIIPEHLLCFDHVRKETFLISCGREDRKVEKIAEGNAEIGDFSVKDTKPDMSKKEFEKCVSRAKEYIKEGDIFQVVLSRQLSASYDGDALQFYDVLRGINPSPYMFYLDFGDVKIAGSSPEMLVRLRDGELTLRPIAGTRQRGKSAEEDEKLKLEMLLDEKERAEHTMLVDLGRNDLGRVAEYGTVQVNELMGIEKYSHVQHIVSNITAALQKGRDAFDVLRATFPAGTVTGAPKIRAMEIIEELEKTRRGPYAGGVGYFDFSGNLDFAIAIRTMFAKNGTAYFQAGAGIVADSVPEREFYETENKLKALTSTIERGGSRA